MKKAMSDGEVQDYVSSKFMDDLDGIEAHGLFDEQDNPATDPHEGTKVEAHGVSIAIKPMNGEQTKAMPKTESAPEDDEELSDLGL